MRFYEGDHVVQIQIQYVVIFKICMFRDVIFQILNNSLHIARKKEQYISKRLTINMCEKE